MHVAEGGYLIALRLSFHPYGLNSVHALRSMALAIQRIGVKRDGGHLTLCICIFYFYFWKMRQRKKQRENQTWDIFFSFIFMLSLYSRMNIQNVAHVIYCCNKSFMNDTPLHGCLLAGCHYDTFIMEGWCKILLANMPNVLVVLRPMLEMMTNYYRPGQMSR